MEVLWFLTKNIQVVGEIPKENVIFCSNHHSFIDTFLFGFLKKGTRCLCHEDVMNFPWKSFLKYHNFVLASIENGCTSLEKNSIGICPSGIIEFCGDNLLPYRRGALVISQKTKVPIVPTYFHYSKYPGKWITIFPVYIANIFLTLTFFIWRSEVKIFLGQPFFVDEDADLYEEAKKLKEKTISLLRR